MSKKRPISASLVNCLINSQSLRENHFLGKGNELRNVRIQERERERELNEQKLLLHNAEQPLGSSCGNDIILFVFL